MYLKEYCNKNTQFRCLNFCLFLLFLSCLFAKANAADSTLHFTHQDSLRGSLNPARSCYDVYYYHLNIIVDPGRQTVTGICTISFLVKSKTDSIQVDLFSNYKVLGVRYDSNWTNFVRYGDHIFVHFSHALNVGEKYNIDVHYTGNPPIAKKAPWDGGFIWGKDSLDRTWVGVACEGLGASSWWPCKDHLSDKPDSMAISIQVPEGYFCVSNGQLRTINNMYSGYNQYNWFVTYPINTYDVTLNIGKYERIHDTFQSKAGILALDYFVLDYHVKQAEAYFSKQVKPMLRCFEHYFGPYPFTRDGYGLVETSYWGMEHQGAIAYGNHFMLNGNDFDFIIVHESAHEWWGNSLSVNDQAEMWLHESFATYAESLYLEYTKGKKAAQEYLDTQRNLVQDKIPLIGHFGVNEYKRADNDIYYKGAWMLHTFRAVINNDSLWFNILYSFQEKYKYRNITSRDFIDFVNSKTGKNYDAFFDQYLTQADLPVLSFNAEQRGTSIELLYYWKGTVPKFTMPVDINIKGNIFRIYPLEKEKKLKISPKQLTNLTEGKIPVAQDANVDFDHYLIEIVQTVPSNIMY